MTSSLLHVVPVCRHRTSMLRPPITGLKLSGHLTESEFPPPSAPGVPIKIPHKHVVHDLVAQMRPDAAPVLLRVELLHRLHTFRRPASADKPGTQCSRLCPQHRLPTKRCDAVSSRDLAGHLQESACSMESLHLPSRPTPNALLPFRPPQSTTSYAAS